MVVMHTTQREAIYVYTTSVKCSLIRKNILSTSWGRELVHQTNSV